ncbi:MAG: glycoside hydrolase family 38 [Opitutaceae bacterium]|jgi:alpha-mannosidase|nr:glycoside hydrolase family 38 [Opitutaceae bacterium]
MPATITIHLIANAHLDPVWLWDAREGLNEGISTCRAMVELLREFPDFRFIRGEAAIYEHIGRHDPELFSNIKKLIAAGRWEPVGGTYIQPDTNLPATESLLRQFVRGRRYFKEKFGRDVTAAWAADSFGHSAGLPEILAAAGMRSFAFTRPPQSAFPLPKPVFWWEAASGARILCYRPEAGWYGTDRDEIEQRLELALVEANKHGLENVACFHGLGNHGGGPSRAQLRLVEQWKARHPELRVIHSGLHDLFAALRKEERRQPAGLFPVIKGELNFCLRGCSASMARFKYIYRRAEAQLARAGLAVTASALAGNQPRARELARPWDDLLFNAFHDILPGTSIERACDDQFAHIGGAFHAAQRAEADALLDITKTINTIPPLPPPGEDAPALVPLLAWNPHPRGIRTHVEMEAALDYRPLKQWQNRRDDVPVVLYDEAGSPVRFQSIAEEHASLVPLPWRRRVVAPVALSPLGVRVFYLGVGRRKQEKLYKSPVRADGGNGITSGLFHIKAAAGEGSVSFLHRGNEWLPGGLQARLYDDEWGSWGGMFEERDSWLLTSERERWVVAQTQILERGPERAALWVRFAGRRSRLDLTFLLCRNAPAITVRARAFLDERSARLKLVFPTGGRAEFEVPGGTVARQSCGEVPGGRWARLGSGARRLGFASDALYGFDVTDDEFRATIARATRHAADERRKPDEAPWAPATDAGELRFSFLLTPLLRRLPDFAAELEQPPLLMPVPARRKTQKNAAPQAGGIVLAAGLRLLALHCAGRNCFELRAQNETARGLDAGVVWLGRRVALGRVKPGEIATWHLSGHAKKGWQARRAAAVSEARPPSVNIKRARRRAARPRGRGGACGATRRMGIAIFVPYAPFFYFALAPPGMSDTELFYQLNHVRSRSAQAHSGHAEETRLARHPRA